MKCLKINEMTADKYLEALDMIGQLEVVGDISGVEKPIAELMPYQFRLLEDLIEKVFNQEETIRGNSDDR